MMNKKTFRVFAAWVVAAIVLSCGAAGIVKAFAATPELKPFFKSEYPSDDSAPKQIAPNLLFFLESSTAMMFAPWGLIPTVNDTYGKTTSNEVLQHKAYNLINNTFGSGMRNVMLGTGDESSSQEQWASPANQIVSADGGYRLVEVQGGYSRMGRDLDRSNNEIGNPDCYYSTDPDKPYFLTFRNRILAWWLKNNTDGTPVALPATNPLSGTFVTNEWDAAKNSYTAIRPYMKGGTKWNSGEKTVPIDLANIHLVPNDSRIYKLKLALWHLLDKEKNGENLSKINVGIAQIYKSYLNSSHSSSFHWDSYVYHGHGTFAGSNPLRMATSGDTTRPGEANYYGAWSEDLGTGYGRINSPYGSGSFFIYGVYPGESNDSPLAYRFFPIALTKQTVMGQKVKYDIGNWGGDTNPDTSANARSWSRALLTLPFDKLYKMESGKPEGTEHLESLTKLIDGMERYPTAMNQNVSTLKKDAIPNNQEIFAIGANFVATGLFGGRSYTPANTALGNATSSGTGVYHQNQPNSTANANSLIQYANTADPNGSSFTYNDGTILLEKGQAAGSVIDFFSPPTGVGYSNGLKFDDATKGFFPVTDSCQQNWVVLFVSGNEALKDFSPQHYTVAKAALKLFQNTLKMRGRHWDGGQWIGQEYSMASGVRTIVVGLVDDDTAKYPDVAPLVADLNAAAKHGDPMLRPGGVPTKPEDWIANTAPNVKAYFAKDVEGIMEALNAIMERIVVGNMGGGSPVSLPQLDSGNPDGSRTVLGASFKMNGDDYQWNADLTRTDLSAQGTKIDSRSWKADEQMRTAPNARKLFTWKESGHNVANLAGNTGIHQEWKTIAGVPNMGDAQKFKKWLYDFGVNDIHQPEDGPVGILGDTQHSNIMVVGDTLASASNFGTPAVVRDRSIYLQTNRGFLHRIDYKTGAEKWAFVPPNIFEDRLKHLKFKENAHSNWDFMEGHDSHPMYLLDGKLTANDVLTKDYVFADPTYKTILIGYLGRGGNGFYAMDITRPGDEPEFLWAIENAYYGTGTVHDDVKTWGATHGTNYGYSRLGLTIVPGVLLTPKVKVTGTFDQTSSVVALPGGLGHKMGKGGDTQGKVLYFFDPNDGEIFHNIALDGMGVTPITYQEGESLSIAGGGKLKYTDSLYTADSEGNVLFVNLSNADANLTTVGKEQIFKLTTTAIIPTPVVVPFAMASARVGIGGVGNDWLFGGTANIAGPGSAISEDMVLSNREQFIFGLNSVKLKSVSGASMSDLAELPYITDTIIKPLYTPTPPHPTTTDNGWYIKLRPYKKDGLIETEPEYASASAFLFNGYLYVATFTPYGGERPCKGADIGAGKIYIFKLVDGRPTETMFAVVMENIKIVGFSGVGRNLAISTQELAEGAIAGAKTALENAGMTDVKLLGEGIIEMIAPAVPAPLPDIPRGVPYIQYWREKFN